MDPKTPEQDERTMQQISRASREVVKTLNPQFEQATTSETSSPSRPDTPPPTVVNPDAAPNAPRKNDLNGGKKRRTKKVVKPKRGKKSRKPKRGKKSRKTRNTKRTKRR